VARQRTPGALWAVLIVAMTLVAYLPALRGGFIWDDDSYVQTNLTLRSAEGLGRIWIEPTAVPQYYPVVFTTLWAEYHLWGLAPVGYHVVNVLLHAACALLLWRLLRRLSVPGAWLAAAVFALHPVEVESVAWISERKNVLSTLLYLGAFHAYWRFAEPDATESHPWAAYVASFVLFLGALLSKSVTASLPAAILLALWWKRGRLTVRDVMPTVPFVVVGAAMGLTTAWLETHHVGARGAEWAFGFAARCCIAGRAFWFYLGKIVWPHPLVFVYPRWQVDPSVWWQPLLPLAAIALVALLWCLRARIGRGPLAATLFFAGSLFPALGFFDVYPMRFSFVADHFQYLASIGPIILLAALVTRIAGQRPAATVGAAALLLVLGVLTWRQASAYQTLEALWRDTLAKNPDAWMAHNNLGALLAGDGRTDEALAEYGAALHLKPDYASAHDNLGATLVRLGRLEEGIAELREAIRDDPGFPDAHFNLGVALEAQGNTAGAVTEYSEAIRLRPTYADAHVNLGNILAANGRPDAAVPHYQEALSARPDDVDAESSLGAAFIRLGRLDDAIVHLRQALRLNPTFPEAHFNLALALGAQRRTDEAIAEYTAALAPRPDFAQAQVGLGLAYVQRGQTHAAVDAFRAALRTRPDWPEVERTLAWILATDPDPAVRNGAEAVERAERICQQTSYRDATALDTLAAAYAEVGRFADAVRTAEDARRIAAAAGNHELADGIAARRDAYRLARPFRRT
jgi:tetratricopeptide (TPR) repeat protein